MPDFWSGRRVLVTGGAGFLGRRVVAQLRERDADVVAPRSAEYDLTVPGTAEAMIAAHRPATIIHLAARVGGIGYNQAEPAPLYLANLLMGTHVIEAARHDPGVDKTVLLGTVCSYPKFTPVPFREESLWDGYPEETNAPYGLAKKAHLVHAQVNAAQYGQRFAYLIPTNLYGPGDKFHPSVSHVIPALIKKCVEAVEAGEDKVEVWGTGRASREYLFVDDAAEAIVLAAEIHDGPDPINLGTDHEVTIRETVETIARIVGFDGELRWDPTKPDGQPRRRVDAGRAEHVLGWRARMPFEDGLRA
ncbi:MAG: GDP-L-fucose synthase, partial [Ilumatobacteraceae bacterium]